jgi:hypothetical protein
MTQQLPKKNLLILHQGRKTELFEELEAFYLEINGLLADAPDNHEEPVSPYLVNIFNGAVRKIIERDSYCKKYLVPDALPVYWMELQLAGKALQGYLKERYK